MCMYLHRYMDSCIERLHASIYTVYCTYIDMHICKHTHTHNAKAPSVNIIYIYIYIYTHTHTHTIHTKKHSYTYEPTIIHGSNCHIHTYIHTHIHTCNLSLPFMAQAVLSMHACTHVRIWCIFVCVQIHEYKI